MDEKKKTFVNSKSVSETQTKIVPECLILRTTRNCLEIAIYKAFSVVFTINFFHRLVDHLNFTNY